MITSTAFAQIRRGISPIPRGLVPGFLSSATPLLARKASRTFRLTAELHSLLVHAAMASQSSREASPKAVSWSCQCLASPPDGPAPPLDFRTAFLIASPVISSKTASCTRCTGPLSKADSSTGWSSKWTSANTCFVSGVSSRTPFDSPSSSMRIASLSRPSKMSDANRSALSSTESFLTFLAGSLLWIATASSKSPAMSPSSQSLRRLPRHLMWSFARESFLGFWSRRCSIVAMAFWEIASSGPPFAAWRYSLAFSRRNHLPCLPPGSLAIFLLKLVVTS